MDDQLLKLMHAVLDGEASEQERAALHRALAADPQAQARFDALKRLFGTIDAVPPIEPPAGFADQVMAALQRSTKEAAASRQPFAKSGVIGPMGSDIKVRALSKPVTARTPSGPIWGRQDMSKRGLWIVGGVAAAVLALFVGTNVQFPPSGDKATGTIVPAERWRGTQPTAADVKLNDGTTTARQPNVPVAGDAAANSAASGANSAASGANSAASGANSAASGANNAASGANNAASGANSAASGANSAASGANNAASGANSAASGANSASSAANNAASGANSAASAANKAASGANSAASAANNAASGANSAASAANKAASGANSAASAANKAASGANSASSAGNSAAAANTAASNSAAAAGGVNNKK